jgi:flagellar biosynthesis/type III secretory pathway chaperone
MLPAPLAAEGAGLEVLLGQELGLLCALETLLENERQALLDRDPIRIRECAEEKRRSLDALTRSSERTRAQWLIQARRVANSGGMPGQLRTLLEAVKARWEQVQSANQCNGAVMKLHHASVLRGLGVLRQALGGTDLYRADGRSSGHYLSA